MTGAPASRPASGVPLLEDLCLLGGLSGLTAILLAATFPLWGEGLHLLCPLRELTGIPCPTCFGTRATLALLAGDWRAALRLNPLVAAAGVALCAYVAWALATVVLAWPRPRISSALIGRAGWVGAGLVVINWIYLVVAHV